MLIKKVNYLQKQQNTYQIYIEFLIKLTGYDKPSLSVVKLEILIILWLLYDKF